ncbi:MAG: bifunctional diaminohydroxyphosphoribosylaminopyrimidine deaminase/5-amino-6-(5-phosphoribosylamino)uracil reductase RibD [Oscillospiraceae bacterium]|nr:bifunctional diaminohydroxyphosphoribosylaminopyrimidine deaminase/5-amino-6-(5-phosphoribosylamino)uracil reductase RibD [Oscillospiraceae bacterium]
MSEQDYMRRAIELAKNGMGWTAPNPMVGAVLVKDGRVIGEGWHRRCGGLHAEREALAARTEEARGATLYVTLEPCCHHGRTPPCTDAILEHGIAKVVIGSRDPNPLVSGQGAAKLRAAGVEVVEDFLRAECDALNPEFFWYITHGSPYAVMKYAMTLDGKIASRTGASRWITGEEARAHVHALRGRYAAILAGVGTVLADDPMLNCRLPGAHQPLRVILDSRLRLPPDCQLCRTARDYPTLVASCFPEPGRHAALEALGVEVAVLPTEAGRVSLPALMELLGKRQISSVLIEGGGQVHEAALRAGIVRHVCAYIAPKLLGGRDAKTPVEGLGAAHPDGAALLAQPRIRRLGEDLLLEYEVTRGMEADVHGHC